jgi:hypothetical protein
MLLTAMRWWAWAAADSTDPIDMGYLAQFGMVGLVAGGGIIFARLAYRRETERCDRLEAEVIRLNNVIIERDNLIIERVIPAVTQAAISVDDATRYLRDLQRERELNVARTAATRRSRQGEDRP